MLRITFFTKNTSSVLYTMLLVPPSVDILKLYTPYKEIHFKMNIECRKIIFLNID